ncbi:MAG: hypothetical protein ACT4O9_16795 [Blastocatellia bacterium]
MVKFDSPLRNLKIASPCSAEWNEMRGDDRKRFCGDCKLNVFNLSGMKSYDAENLLRNSEGRLCVRYFQRPDGTILTQDCPVGWAKVKRRVSAFAATAFALALSMVSGLFAASFFVKNGEIGRRFAFPFATPTPKHEPLMGAVAMPSPTPKVKPSPTPKTGVVEWRGEVERLDSEEKLRQMIRKAEGV